MKKFEIFTLILAVCSVFVFASCTATRPDANGSGSVPSNQGSSGKTGERNSEILNPIDDVEISGSVYIVKPNTVLKLNKNAATITYSQYSGYNEYLEDKPTYTWTEPSENYELVGGERVVQAVHDSTVYRLSEKNGGVYLKMITDSAEGEFEIYEFNAENYKLPDFAYIYKTPTTVTKIKSRICLKLTDDEISIYYSDTVTTSITPKYVIEDYRLQFSSSNLFITKNFPTGESFTIQFTSSGIRITLKDDSTHGIEGYSATCTI